jgi:hypothetical protein
MVSGIGKALTETSSDSKVQKEVVKLLPGQEEELAEIENKDVEGWF